MFIFLRFALLRILPLGVHDEKPLRGWEVSAFDFIWNIQIVNFLNIERSDLAFRCVFIKLSIHFQLYTDLCAEIRGGFKGDTQPIRRPRAIWPREPTH